MLDAHFPVSAADGAQREEEAALMPFYLVRSASGMPETATWIPPEQWA
jgi:hypothetical protein